MGVVVTVRHAVSVPENLMFAKRRRNRVIGLRVEEVSFFIATPRAAAQTTIVLLDGYCASRRPISHRMPMHAQSTIHLMLYAWLLQYCAQVWLLYTLDGLALPTRRMSSQSHLCRSRSRFERLQLCCLLDLTGRTLRFECQ